MADEKLLENAVDIDGKLVTYRVSSLGRYFHPRSRKWLSLTQVKLSGQDFFIHQLVLLAKDRLTKLPTGPDGSSLSVDHIDRRKGEFPHRVDNLRWATRKEQNLNRGPRE